MFGNPITAGAAGGGTSISLTPPKDSNLSLLVSWLNDPEVMRLLNPSWQQTTLEKERQQLERFKEANDQIMWNIEADRTCIGAVWINEIKRPENSGFYGIMIGDKSRWGQGIATLVKRAVTNWALTEGGFDILHVDIYTGNEASKRTSEKVGYELVPAMIEWDGKTYEGLHGSMSKDRWQTMKSKQ